MRGPREGRPQARPVQATVARMAARPETVLAEEPRLRCSQLLYACTIVYLYSREFAFRSGGVVLGTRVVRIAVKDSNNCAGDPVSSYTLVCLTS